MAMAARNIPAPDGTPRRKAVLFCPRCGHESTLPGDWLVEEAGVDVEYACPKCGATVVERRDPFVA
jgi:predicted RNA-binding Zn-ribbon protein involved in translation (DUF1610 family)